MFFFKSFLIFHCRSKAQLLHLALTRCSPSFVSRLLQEPSQIQSVRVPCRFFPLQRIHQTPLMKNASENWSTRCPSSSRRCIINLLKAITADMQRLVVSHLSWSLYSRWLTCHTEALSQLFTCYRNVQMF